MKDFEEKWNEVVSARISLYTGKIKRGIRRVLAIILALCMVLTGFPGIPASLAAADDTIQDFEMTSADLKYAMEKAVSQGEPIPGSAFKFTGAESEVYDELFYWGDVYELTDDVDIDTDGSLTLRIFMSEDGDQGLDSYRFTGEENIIFLILNGTGREKTARIYIDGAVTDLIPVAAKNGVNMEVPGVQEILTEDITETEEDIEETEEEADFEITPATKPAGVAGASGSGTGGAGSEAPPETTPDDDGIPIIDTSFEDAMQEADPGIAGPGADKEQGPGQEPDQGEEGSNIDEEGDSSYTDEEDDADDSTSDGSESVSDGIDEAGSEDGMASNAGNDDGNDPESGSGSDSGNASDSGNDGGENGSDVGSSEGSSSDDPGDSYSSSDEKGESLSAAVSTHRIGILAASVTQTAADGEDNVVDAEVVVEGEHAVSENEGIVIEIKDISDEDNGDIVETEETEVRIATASDADSDKDDNSYQTIAGEIYDPVLVGNNKAAAAFVTTVDGLGLRMSTVDCIPDTELEYQTIKACIYRDSDYEWNLADGTNITLSGMMPENAVAKAYPVEVEIEDIHVLAAYDITIYDENGCEYQPDDDSIEVVIENDRISEALDLEHELTVFHMEDEDDEPQEIAVIEPAPRMKMISFMAERFSIYIVGEDDKLYETDGRTHHYVYNVTFNADLNGDGNYTLLSTQTLSAGEHVEQPGVPDKEDCIFKGWFTEKEDGIQYDFSESENTLPEITGDTDIDLPLYAQYEELHYVHYMIHAHTEGDEEINAVFHTEPYKADDTLDTSNAEQLYLKDGYLSFTDPVTGITVTTMAVTGWKDASGREWTSGDTIDWAGIDGDLELYPVVESAYWVYFNMNGVHDIEDPAPEYVLADAVTIGDLPRPEASGYSFDGWYTESEGGTVVTSASILSTLPQNDDESITLYAHWSEDYAAYTINIWRQKATDGQAGLDNKEIISGETYNDYINYYDYAESHYVPASQSRLKTGDTPTVSTVDNWSTYTGYGSTSTNSASYKNHPEYYGFEYSYSSSAYGTATTSAIRTLNELETVTMAADGSTIINIYYNRVTISWTFSTSSFMGSTVGTLTGLYDTNITPANGSDAGGTLSAWPDPYNGNKLWSTANTSYTFEAKFIIIGNSTARTFTPGNNTGSKLLHYYLEVTDEDTQVDVGGDAYNEAVNTYNIAYTRTVNNTEYVYCRTINIASNFTIEDKFIGYHYLGYLTNNTDTAIPDNQKGTSIGSQNEYFVFSNAYTYTITLFSEDKVVGVNGAGEAVPTQNDYTYKVKYGEDLSNYPFPETLDGAVWGPAYYYHFADIWYEDPYLTSLFTETTMPNSNLAAYADWELNDITVTFDTRTEDVKAPDTQKIKATETAADPGVLTREGYTHVGWVDQNGKVFNFETVLYTDTTLTAIWKADDETGYQLHYNLNVTNSNGLLDPADYPDETDISTNTEHFEAGDYEDLWTIEKAFATLSEEVVSRFICWNTAADGTGTSYYPDDEIYIDGDTTLYAIWAHENGSTLILVYNYPDSITGDDQSEPITRSNLSEIDLSEFAEDTRTTYHYEIKVGDGDDDHIYRFDGWSVTPPGNDPTDKDVDIEPEATVKADTLDTSAENVNYLYAVWVEVHNITVNKVVENDSANYTVPSDQTFDFIWSFVDGEGKTNNNTGEISIADGGSFIIPDVASGERVTITETAPETGFTTSYNGAQINASDDGNGTYSFDMAANSLDITVTNTVITNTLTAVKVWADDGQAGIDHSKDIITVTFKEDEEEINDGTVTLTGDNGWQESIELVLDNSKVYTAEETAVKGYTNTVTSSVDGSGDITFTIINTPVETTEINVTKVWDDNNNQDGLRGNYSLTLTGTVEGGNAAYYTDTQTFTQFRQNYTWSDVPITDEQGNKISYTVSESLIPEGYTASVTGDAVNGFIVTNTHIPEVITVSGIKTWNDNNNEDESRPVSITIRLYANGTAVTDQNGDEVIAIVTAAENWAWSFNNLDRYKNGVEIRYTVTEDAVHNYSTTYDEDDYDVTNTHTPGKTSVSVTKVWNDDSNRDGIRPDFIMIDLLADGDAAKDVEGEPITLTLSGDGNIWTGSFTGLNIYSGDKAIEYTIREEDVKDDGTLGENGEYTSSVRGDASTGYFIINTYEPELINDTGTVTIDKVWEDANDQDGIRPDSIIVTLTGKAEETEVYSSELEIMQEGIGNTWTATVDGLYKYADGGKEISYTITEADIEIPAEHKTGYTAKISGGADENDNYTFTITNIHEPEAYGENGSFTVNKYWNDDGSTDERSSYGVTLTGMTEGRNDPVYTDTQQLSAETTKYEWTGLARYHKGQEIVYIVKETAIPDNYAASYAEYDGEPYIINTKLYTPDIPNPGPEDYGKITVTKVWDDDGDRDRLRPENINVSLLANDKAAVDADGREVSLVWEKDSDKWTATVKNLPGYDADGEIIYTVKEEEVENYTVTYDPVSDENTESSGKITDGTVIIKNSHIPQKINDPDDPKDPDDPNIPDKTKPGELPVSKEWIDNDDELKYRPTEVSIKLLANGDEALDETGKPVKITLSESNGWTASFTELNKYENGKEIEYSVEEIDVPVYYRAGSTVMSGSGAVTLTNSLSFFPMDEEIVPGNDDEKSPDTWIDRESVNEYQKIEIEMSTTLPNIDPDIVKAGDYRLTFHNELVTQLVLDELDNDFIVDINGSPISHEYYEIEGPEKTAQKKGILQFFSGSALGDDCTFHVNIDLSGLLKDGKINEDDLGTAAIRVFFYADLETEADDVNGSYTSTGWYDVKAAGVTIYSSEKKVVSVWTSEIIISKTAGDTNKPLEGAVFGIYYDEAGANPVSRNDEAFTIVTNDEGQGLFVGLANGTYYLKELEAPSGYKKVNDIKVELKYSDTSENHITMVNVADPPAGDGEGGSGDSGDGGDGADGGKTPHRDPGNNGSGGGSGSSRPGTTAGSNSGPGIIDETVTDWPLIDLNGYEYIQDENGNWILARTGQSRALPVAMATGLTAAAALIVLLFFKRRESRKG